eukprot:Plantae.Rhodophyta-Rhodochaete_pulchella.ctg37831.p1 GENE.Plantae.Rhodophyta-Rhodochaete_pulchella.ctg37831~~Plantae.Rhodophyta-Rhodochaete_pulchella.ctg37831.p1  ORF type:complete len:422 (-),score=59.06 Plantae.Rhodophyta-Rhodochaete_pulchella.ctg37831:43-1221(-)
MEARTHSGEDPFLNFLARSAGAKDALSSFANTAPCHVVLGNQAADLDSMTSSMACAFLRMGQSGQSADVPILPVMNVARADFPLRTEAAMFMNDLKIPVHDLTFIDEVDLLSAANLSITLVDHNKLSPSQESLAKHVVEIVDHHDDEGDHLDAVRTIEPVGSCSTLISESFLNPPALDTLRNSPSLCNLLLGTILLDTANLNRSRGRCTSSDEDAVVRLRSFLADPPDNSTLFEKLQSAKFDTSRLSPEQLLRKDFKDYAVGSHRLGISSVGLSLTGLEEKFGGAGERAGSLLSRFQKERALDIFVVMAAFYSADGAFCREVLVNKAATQDTAAALGEFLLAESDLKVEVIDTSAFRETGAFIGRVGDVTASRKKLQPRMAAFLLQLEGKNQ